jgi:ethanolamine permease
MSIASADRPSANSATGRSRTTSLRRFAGVWSIWALGVSGVIPGEYSGWNYGLITGGFGGMLVATLVVIVMYLGLCYSLAEMSSAMPFAGGGYAYSRCALGVWGGYLAGTAQNIEYILTAAAVVVSVGDALERVVFGLSGLHLPDVAAWAIAYAIFTAINIYGIELTCRIALLLTVLALAVLAVFAVGALPQFDISLALNVPVAPGGSAWLPNGMAGIARSIPFAIWFLVVIELTTLTAEETKEPETTVPKGILFGVGTLIVAALLVLFLNSALPPGARLIGNASQPLLLGFEHLLGGHLGPTLLAVFGLAAYVAGFHAMIYAYGRSIFALARGGYLPAWLAATHRTRQTPYAALLVGSILGFAAAILVKYSLPDEHVDAILVTAAALAAILSYILQMLSFLVLRRNRPDMSRPYVSPLGATGAMTTLVIAVAACGLMLLQPSYREGMLGCTIIYALFVLYFMIRHPRPDVTVPEEAFAIVHGIEQPQ